MTTEPGAPMVREGYTIAHRDELERTGNWTLVRRSLGCRSFGVNLVEIAPGESIPEHDETQRDQEELFLVISGWPVLVIDGEDDPARPGTFARIDPQASSVRSARTTGCGAVLGADRLRPHDQWL